MLRFFSLYVPLDYTGTSSDEAVAIPRKTSAGRRCALFNIEAFSRTAGRVQKHEIQEFTVANANYLRGDPCNLALVASSAYEKLNAALNGQPQIRAHWPGTQPVLEGGQAAGVIPVPPGAEIRVKLKMLAAGQELDYLVFNFVQLPDEDELADKELQAVFDRLWARWMSGVGVTVFYSNKKAYSAALSASRQSSLLRETRARRGSPRGIVVATATGVFDATEFLASSVEISSNEQRDRPRADVAEPAALALGHAGFENHSRYAQDMREGKTSTIDLTAPASGGTARTWYFLTPFETLEADRPTEYAGPSAW